MLILSKFSNISTFPEQKHKTTKELFKIITALCELPIKKRENKRGAQVDRFGGTARAIACKLIAQWK